MSQAETAFTTRRALMGAALALPAIVAAPVQAEPVDHWQINRECVERIARLHPKGRQVALEAYRVDVDWHLIKSIDLEGPFAPVLTFGQRPGGAWYPTAEIVVSTAGAYLNSRVG
jgi:hypothetical protein